MKASKIQKAALGLLLCAISLQCLAQTSQLNMPEGTKIRVRLEQNLSSATAEEGQPVQLSVADDVRIGDTVVIKQGAAAVGSVTLAVKKRRMGRTGKLDFSVDRVVAEDGSSIPLRYSPQKRDGGSHSLATGIITAGVGVAFWPAAPFVLLIQGKDAMLHRGMEMDVFTDQTFAMKNPAATPATTQPASAPAVAVQVTSQPQGGGNRNRRSLRGQYSRNRADDPRAAPYYCQKRPLLLAARHAGPGRKPCSRECDPAVSLKFVCLLRTGPSEPGSFLAFR